MSDPVATDLAASMWLPTQLAEAVEALVSATRLAAQPATQLRELIDDDLGLSSESLSAGLAALGLEGVPFEASGDELTSALSSAAPAVLAVRADHQLLGYLVLVRNGARSSIALGRDGVRRRVSARSLKRLVHDRGGSEVSEAVEEILEAVAFTGRRREAVRRALSEEQRREQALVSGLMIRPRSRALLRELLSGAVVRSLVVALVCHVHTLLWVASWAVLGWLLLSGADSRSWWLGWALLLLCVAPVMGLSTLAQARTGILLGAALRRRLVDAAGRIAKRRLTVAEAFSRILEVETLETSLATGGLAAAFAVLDLALAAWILSWGIGGAVHALMLLAFASLCVGLGLRHLKIHRMTVSARLESSEGLLEQMEGYRTRLVQEDERLRHQDEDAQLDAYLVLARRFDRSTVWLSEVMARGWLLVGLVGLMPWLIPQPSEVPELAVTFGGLLFSYRALGRFCNGLRQLVAARVAWERVRELLEIPETISAGESAASHTLVAPPPAELTNGEKVLEARGLSVSLPGREGRVVDGCDLTLFEGDRVLIQGPSGSGKSTLLELLAGLEKPTAGSLLLRGFNMGLLAPFAWRSRVICVPQFHQNHVLSGSFALNALMGRCWPPAPGDLELLRRLVSELGLDDLVNRMPSGIFQQLGESGWRLSHGELSRLFMLRALLQEPEVLLLDESLGSLDPSTVRTVLPAIERRCRVLVVVAHA